MIGLKELVVLQSWYHADHQLSAAHLKSMTNAKPHFIESQKVAELAVDAADAALCAPA
jgi:hypothetical protein